MPDSGIVFTICQGNYDLGAAALLNSLSRHGFSGRFWCFFRDKLPTWHRQLTPLSAESADSERVFCFRLGGSIEVHFPKFVEKGFPGQFKPALLERIINTNPKASYVAYFDPDIVVAANWAFYEKWMEFGIAVCEDLEERRHRTDPRRFVWKEFCSRQAIDFHRELDVYLNSGFVGVSSSYFPFASEWRHWQETMMLSLSEEDKLKTANRLDDFHRIDQESFNIALCCTSLPISIMCRAAMGFEPGDNIMFHACGKNKPWNGPFIPSALVGHPPSVAARMFTDYFQHPIRTFPPWEYRARRLDVMAARCLGRLFRKYW